MEGLFGGIYKGRTVLVTGHTGFKGSWLSLWLLELGANVVGYSLNLPTKPCHFEIIYPLLQQKGRFVHIIGDIKDYDKLKEVFDTYKPEIVFHLAAQSIVRESYKYPAETFQTNVMGTVNLFEVCRKAESVRVIINVTSDKCYQNKDWVWGYREIDPLGGDDPYSASKACSEIITNCYRKSFFTDSNPIKLVASVRAGNVIGGGDWSKDRLIPDLIRAVVEGKKALIRNPEHIRPWQHVLDPLSGYLLLGQKLLEGKREFADAWNFGPSESTNLSVLELVKKAKHYWNDIEYECSQEYSSFRESKILKLDSSKANSILGWKPVWDIDKAIEKTIKWYRLYYIENKVSTLNDLREYVDDARRKGYEFAN